MHGFLLTKVQLLDDLSRETRIQYQLVRKLYRLTHDEMVAKRYPHLKRRRSTVRRLGWETRVSDLDAYLLSPAAQLTTTVIAADVGY